MKLEAAGVRGSTLQWFVSYLLERRQRTRVDSAVSGFAPLSAGVPQGAILSPLLFILYVNDIPCSPSIHTNLFADDTSVFITDPSPSLLSTRLQTAADTLSAWFQKWKLSVNVPKSAALAICSRHMEAATLSITLNGSPITQVDQHKHLGLTISETLSWTAHVDFFVTKASQKIGLLYRFRKRFSSLALSHLYITSIRPSLEYSSLAWCGSIPGQQRPAGEDSALCRSSHYWHLSSKRYASQHTAGKSWFASSQEPS